MGCPAPAIFSYPKHKLCDKKINLKEKKNGKD